MRKIILTLVVVTFTLYSDVLSAQTDSTYLFRFFPKKDMFFVPNGQNSAELERLSQIISRYREEIADGSLPLYVDGYCNSLSGEAENLAVARLRSNRVKSQLILHQGIKEKHFITHNHATTGDFVTVKILIPVKQVEVAVKPVTETVPTKAVEKKDEPKPVTTEADIADSLSAMQPDVADCSNRKSSLYLRANLLRWATLTPNLGIEWRINRCIGILVNGSWTSWSWDNKNRRYALWEVSPEVRYYIGKEKRGYVGAMYHIGEFNYKLGETGKQGDYQGGGITAGYQLKLSRALSLDLGLGLGYIRADYDKYEVIDNVRVRKASETKNWWGPVSAGVTLMWNIY